MPFGTAFALLALLGSPGRAGNWRSIGPGGGNLNARPVVSPSAPATAFVAGQNSTGVFRTDDDGRTWRHLDVRSVAKPFDIVATDPRNPRSLLGHLLRGGSEPGRAQLASRHAPPVRSLRQRFNSCRCGRRGVKWVTDGRR